MSDVSAVTHLLPTVNEGFVSTLDSTISSGATEVPLTDATNLTNGTTFVGIIEPGETKQQVFTGLVDTGGVQITNVKWTRGTDVSHSGGVTIVDYVTGTALNMITKHLATEHNDDGTHSNVTADSLVVFGTITVGGRDVTQLTPTGSIITFAGAAPPSGWASCDGTAVNRTDFSGLFAVIGTTYGSGNGTTTFNLPDMRQRFPLGKTDSGTGSTLGSTGGNIDHQHDYYLGTGQNSSRPVLLEPNNIGGTGLLSGASTRNLGSASINGSFIATSLTNGSQEIWAGTTTSNNPPYLTLNYIIKT